MVRLNAASYPFIGTRIIYGCVASWVSKIDHIHGPVAYRIAFVFSMELPTMVLLLMACDDRVLEFLNDRMAIRTTANTNPIEMIDLPPTA
jgi:hypothetical protein